MTYRFLLRLSQWLSGLWLGIMVCAGLLAAPSLFNALDRTTAGIAAGAIFNTEAYVSLFLGGVLMAVDRRLTAYRIEALASTSTTSISQFSTALLLLVLILASTVLGHFVLLPMMQQAKSSVGFLSFGQLHGISMVLFYVKMGLVGILAWKATSPSPLSQN